MVARLVRPFRALVSFGMSNRRASPWAALGCPVGAKGRDLSWRLPWGRFLRFEILSVVLLLAAWRFRGFSLWFPSRTQAVSTSVGCTTGRGCMGTMGRSEPGIDSAVVRRWRR
jgi:hypothetical protein